jgi:hypothetical protein
MALTDMGPTHYNKYKEVTPKFQIFINIFKNLFQFLM